MWRPAVVFVVVVTLGADVATFWWGRGNKEEFTIINQREEVAYTWGSTRECEQFDRYASEVVAQGSVSPGTERSFTTRLPHFDGLGCVRAVVYVEDRGLGFAQDYKDGAVLLLTPEVSGRPEAVPGSMPDRPLSWYASRALLRWGPLGVAGMVTLFELIILLGYILEGRQRTSAAEDATT